MNRRRRHHHHHHLDRIEHQHHHHLHHHHHRPVPIGKLGKRPAIIDPRTLQLGKYLLSTLPPAPPAVDYTMGIKDFSMMLNDALGDCVIAAIGHAQQIFSAAARSFADTPPDSVILAGYENWCGYVPGKPRTDQGCYEISVLNAWRKSSFYSYSLSMYADPNPRNLAEIKQAIHLFGGVFLGIQLPVSVQGLSVWDVSSGPDAVPGSWGGHAVWVCAYRTNLDGSTTFTCISWGGLIDITEAFWLYNDPSNGPYIDEVHALISPEFINRKSHTTPTGLNLMQMEADMLQVTA